MSGRVSAGEKQPPCDACIPRWAALHLPLGDRYRSPNMGPRASAAGAEADSYLLGSTHQFGLYDDPLSVVGESAGLQGDDAFARNGLGD
jgi:hypothetical protein